MSVNDQCDFAQSLPELLALQAAVRCDGMFKFFDFVHDGWLTLRDFEILRILARGFVAHMMIRTPFASLQLVARTVCEEPPSTVNVTRKLNLGIDR